MNYPTALSGPSFNFQISEGSAKLVLYFSGTKMGGGRFNYWQIGNGIDTHRLFINNGRNHWYQQGVPGLGDSVDDTVETIRLWAQKLGVKEFYAVGQSMGAFGAILHGAKLGARVLAFNAETVLHLEAGRSIRMMQDKPFVAHPDLNSVIAEARLPIFALAGERDPVDIYCLDRIERQRNFHPKSMFGVGHGLASHLHNRGRFVPMLARFIDNRPPPTTRAYGAALDSPGFPQVFYDQHRHFTAHRLEKAVEAGHTAASLYQRADHSFYLTASALMRLKNYAQALPFLERALELAPNFPDYRFLLAQYLTNAGDKDRAIQIHEGIIAIRPAHAPSYFEMGMIHLSRGDLSQALESARRATELKPENVKFAVLRQKIERRLAMPGRQYAPALWLTDSIAEKYAYLYSAVAKLVAKRS
ncbi:tetratricopeptide repeat protein [Mesorhizobium sp. IMUNJ 23232]|uniref:tetratricopeptide repeat protein n=1 Tax=Mesorhizobium sp. IMUNJ 23232 TaxID=3376064 RepID=UPI0037B35E88